MNSSNNNTSETEAESRKPRISRLAIASLVISLAVPCAWLLMKTLDRHFWIVYGEHSQVYQCLTALTMAVFFLWLAAPVLSVIAFVKINRSAALLKGEGVAIAGLIVWAAVFVLIFG